MVSHRYAGNTQLPQPRAHVVSRL